MEVVFHQHLAYHKLQLVLLKVPKVITFVEHVQLIMYLIAQMFVNYVIAHVKLDTVLWELQIQNVQNASLDFIYKTDIVLPLLHVRLLLDMKWILQVKEDSVHQPVITTK